MESRYLDGDDNLIEIFLNVVEERFPGLVNLKFKLIYDTKRRIKQGKIVLASTELASPKLKFFTQDDIATEGYDYIIIVDKKAWELSNDVDKKRIMSHELRHCFIDEKGSLKIIGHEINEFYAELKLNSDDPEWAKNLATLVFAVYEQEKEQTKDRNSTI